VVIMHILGVTENGVSRMNAWDALSVVKKKK
jgi:hypothetical protein